MSLTRKEFLGTIGKVAIGAAGVAVLSACGDDDDGGTPTIDAAAGQPDAPLATIDAAPGTPDAAPPIDAVPTSCVDNGTNVVISSNHGHVMIVSKDDVIAGVDKIYDIMGSSPHTHSVTITASQFAVLAANQSVMSTSTSAGHTHVITVTCA